MSIKIPPLKEQKRFVFEQSTNDAIATLKKNLDAPSYPAVKDFDESNYSNLHYYLDREDWEPPHPDVVNAYITQLKNTFPDEYGSDKKIANLLGVTSDRRIREYRTGERKMPKSIWRVFMILTGRHPQDVLEVLGYFE